MAWAIAEDALAACKTDDLPESQRITVFTNSSKAFELYQEGLDNPIVYNVRLVGQNGGRVPVAAVDLIRCSEWFKAYLKNRQVNPSPNGLVCPVCFDPGLHIAAWPYITTPSHTLIRRFVCFIDGWRGFELTHPQPHTYSWTVHMQQGVGCIETMCTVLWSQCSHCKHSDISQSQQATS